MDAKGETPDRQFQIVAAEASAYQGDPEPRSTPVLPQSHALPIVVNLRREPYDVYIGRAGRNRPPSQWGNPCVVGRPLSQRCLDLIRPQDLPTHLRVGRRISRDDAIDLYRLYLEKRLETGSLTTQDFSRLMGKTLGCFCKPLPCHGDVIREFCRRLCRPADLPT